MTQSGSGSDRPAISQLAEAVHNFVAGASWSRAPVSDEALVLASRNRITPVLADYEDDDSPDRDATRAAVRRDRVAAILTNSRNLALARRVGPMLEGHAIRSLIFKGPLHLRQLYGDLQFRRSNDVDLLVHAPQFDSALDHLSAGGFVPVAGSDAAWWRKGLGEVHLKHPDHPGCTLDLHWSLQQPGCPIPARPDEFFDLSVPVQLGSVRLAMFDPVGGLLVSALNLVKGIVGREPSGRYALDIAVALTRINDLDRDRLEAFAARQGLARTIGMARAFASACFDLDLPAVGQPPALDRAQMRKMVLDPGDPRIDWPRRHRLLWAMTDGQRSKRGTAFARETARTLHKEFLRRARIA